jgi:hypothetical protein
MFKQLHAYLIEAGKEIRDQFASREVHRLDFQIEIEGRTDGDLTLKYSIGEYGCTVTGNDLEKVIEEFFRRRGWNERNAPLELPKF